jgi:hypothetical protein
MSKDPLDDMVRGFSWGVGRKAANSLPVWLGVAVVAILTMLTHCHG